MTYTFTEIDSLEIDFDFTDCEHGDDAEYNASKDF